MARWEFKLPDVGEGVTEGEIVGWLVKAGDLVTEDQALVEVMTDKATVTITAPKAGKVVETHGRVGETVPVHSVLVVFDLDGALPPGASAHAGHANGTKPARSEPEPAAMAVGRIEEKLPGLEPGAPGYFNERPLATPATRKFARDMNVDLRRVPPSGPESRVTKRDVESFHPEPPPARVVARAPEAPLVGAVPVVDRPERPAASPAVASPAVAEPFAAPGPAALAALEERVPMAGLRRKIAQKMARSTATAAHFTFVEECDVTELKGLRERLMPPAQARGVKLSFLPFVVKAVVFALKKHPLLNSTLDETTNEIVLRRYYNIGIATATQGGLIVPVVKDADRRGLLDIAREIERLSEDARAGKSRLDDLHGSTFTITSLGAKGGLMATPIINFPEVAILGVHQMKSKPVVRDNQIVIGDVMLLSLSFDHRIVDGHVGAEFAYEIIGILEKPERLLLEMA
jgi:pyruvate dehydrogenase E2 component (dihydrolipoamide acetyltransferase)